MLLVADNKNVIANNIEQVIHPLYQVNRNQNQAIRGESDALIFLQQSQSGDGNWAVTSASLNSVLPTSTNALQALQVAETAVSTNQLDAIQYIQNETVEVTPFLAERILALAATNEDISADVAELLNRQNEDGGWGTAVGHESNVWDSALALSAVKAAGVADTAVLGLGLNYLAWSQNDDNGWGLLRNEESHIFYTALVLQTFNAHQALYDLSGFRGQAVAYLRNQQHPDGGYGTPTSTPFETALVLQAILEAGFPLTTAEDDAIAYLNATQEANGSWVDDPYSTALALRALVFPRDSDGDGMSDDCENSHGLNPNDPTDALLDNDNDGLTNLEECRLGTNPNLADSDSDTVDDAIEIRCQSDPLDNASFNRPPQFTSLPLTTATNTEPHSDTATATDADGDVPTFSLTQAPAGMTITFGGDLSWTPTQTGSFFVTILADDGRGCQTSQPYTLTVLAQGIDLTITAVDISSVTTDPHTLVALGTTQVDVHNQGGNDFAGDFNLLLFADVDENAAYDAGSDTLLGSQAFSGTIASEAVETIAVSLSGLASFRDDLVYAFVDAANTVPEADETNNLGHSGQTSLHQPATSDAQPMIEWQWNTSASTPVVTPPIVAPLIDTNGDGLVNERDIPAVIAYALGNFNSRLVALRGDTGSEIFSVPHSGDFSGTSAPAVGDLDGDGLPEIVTIPRNGSPLRAFNNDGTEKWSVAVTSRNSSSLVLVDLNGDGQSEIIYGDRVYHGDGTLFWGDDGYWGAYAGAPQVADLNMDGSPEVIFGPSAYDQNGNQLWHWTSYQPSGGSLWAVTGTLDGGSEIITFDSDMMLTDGYTAVANIDNEPLPEVIVVVSSAQSSGIGRYNDALWIFEDDGQIHSGPFILGEDVLNETIFRFGAPTVADFDGNGEPEIAVAAYKNKGAGFFTFTDPSRIILYVLRPDGTTLWQRDLSPNGLLTTPWPPSAFDFDNDGQTELVYQDGQILYIFNGSDGTIRFKLGSSYPINYSTRHPTIADVDNDGGAEILVPLSTWTLDGSASRQGIMALGDVLDNWGHSRRVWNQWQYHVTNINEDASIPTIAANNWELYNNQRAQMPIANLHPQAAPDLTVSKVTINQTACPTSISITARIGNGGGLHAPAGLAVNYYDGDPNSGGTLLATLPTTQALYPGEFEDVTLAWNGALPSEIYVTINETITPELLTTANLASLTNTWAQTSGMTVNSGALVNTGAYRGIDGSVSTGWSEVSSTQNIDPGPAWYEVRFPQSVNASSVTIVNSFATYGFLTGTLSFSNGFSTAVSLDPNGEGTINFAEQANISWIRLTATTTKDDGAGLHEFIVAGSYTDPVPRFNEGNGRLHNNSVTVNLNQIPCDTVTNVPPQITSSPNVTVDVSAAYSYNVDATDANNDPLTYALTTAPAGMTIDENTGLINWQPTAVGLVAVTVEVDDNQGGTTQQTFTIDVTVLPDINHAPQITSTPATTAPVAELFSYAVLATDLDNDALLYTLQQAPAGASLDPQTGQLIWTPTDDQLGNQLFTIAVQDITTTVTQSFSVTVTTANLPLPPLPQDNDSDSFVENDDCDDTNANVNPGQTEIVGNGLDDDCNAATPDTLPADSVSCGLVTDKLDYVENTLTQATLTLTNDSSNLSIQGLVGTITIRNSSDQILFTDTVTIQAMPPSGLYRATVGVPSGTLPIDTYEATLDLAFGASNVCQDTATFSVSALCLIPDPVSDLRISEVSSDVMRLDWTHIFGANQYEVWYAINDPYFNPTGGDCSNPGPYACSLESNNFFEHTQTGNVGDNFTYLVLASNSCGATADIASGRTGSFEFSILPGN